jgi:hypothetical protein
MALTSGCASITRGTTEAYVVETKPPGAEINSSSGWRCISPCSVKVKRRSDFVLTITKSNYETVKATVTSSIDGAGAAGMAGNVILGGLIGAGIDAGTGAMHSHKPNPLVVEMVASGLNIQIPTAMSPSANFSNTVPKKYVAQTRGTSVSTTPYTSSQGYRPTNRAYLDDYDLVPQKVRPQQRIPVVLGQKVESD